MATLGGSLGAGTAEVRAMAAMLSETDGEFPPRSHSWLQPPRAPYRARQAGLVALVFACLAGFAIVLRRASSRQIVLPTGSRKDLGAPIGRAAATIGLSAAEAAAPTSLAVSGFCSHLHCANGVYVRQGVLNNGRPWYAGNGTGKCMTEWLFYDPDPRRDGTVPAQWVFYGTMRAPWERGIEKKVPQWDGKEYKRLPEEDYHRHAFFATESRAAAPPQRAKWKVLCQGLLREETEAVISISPSAAT
uniref:Uncharacterized protein n=1 Tax=Alexandrium monilatum TaxID=311494 RepID=A0A7S4SET8_9DINO